MSQTLDQTLNPQLVQLRCDAANWADGLPADGFSPWLGICYHLDLGAPDWSRLDDLLAAWPGSGGCEIYPVPHPTKTPADAFAYCGAQEMWNPKFKYARNRLALLEWLIEQTQHQPEESQP